MPIAAKFSETFYEKFGHEATGELVEYLNTIDADYRAELERLNDANWGRFEARLDQRITEVRAGFAELKADLIKWMFRFWLGSTITTVGLVLTVVGLLRS